MDEERGRHVAENRAELRTNIFIELGLPDSSTPSRAGYTGKQCIGAKFTSDPSFSAGVHVNRLMVYASFIYPSLLGASCWVHPNVTWDMTTSPLIAFFISTIEEVMVDKSLLNFTISCFNTMANDGKIPFS